MKQFKTFITYIGFYLVSCVLLAYDQLSVLVTKANGEPNAVGAWLGERFGQSYWFGAMFIPIIVLVCHKIFGFLDDAEGMSAKTTKLLGLFSSLVLVAVQVLIRLKTDNDSFFTGLVTFTNSGGVPTDIYDRALAAASFFAVGVLGYCFFSAFIGGVGYNFVEVTTYYTDSGFAYDEQVSGLKTAIWPHIVLGIATTALPSLMARTPLILIPLFFFIITLMRYRTKKSLAYTCVAFGAIALLACVAFLFI